MLIVPQKPWILIVADRLMMVTKVQTLALVIGQIRDNQPVFSVMREISVN